MQTNRDPVRTNIRTMHASFVVMFLLMFVIFGVGAYETLAAIINPGASILLPIVDARSRSVQSTASGPQWIEVVNSTQVYSAQMDPLRIAQPGERYQITSIENGWALVVRDGDTPDHAVWVALDERVEKPGTVNRNAQQALMIVVILGVVLFLSTVIASLIRSRLRRRPRRRPIPVVTPPDETTTDGTTSTAAAKEAATNGSGRIATPS